MQQTGFQAGYREVEYLENPGNGYIDSGIECTSDLAVEFKFMCLNDRNNAICGGISTVNAPVYFRHHCSPTIATDYWMQNDSSNVASINKTMTVINAIHELFVDPVQGVYKLDGVQGSFNPVQVGLTTGRSYGILGRISDTGAIQSKKSRCYFFKFYRNSALIGHFIPCVRKSDNKPGMYDTVSKTFYTNAGTGEFIVPN